MNRIVNHTTKDHRIAEYILMPGKWEGKSL